MQKYQKMKIFLAGRIEGLSWKDANNWREDAIIFLWGGISNDVYNPCSFIPKEHRNSLLNANNIHNRIGMIDNNFKYIRQADVILVNLDVASIGTLLELGAAHILHIPIVAFNIGQCKEHPSIKNIIDCQCDTLEEACEYILKLSIR